MDNFGAMTGERMVARGLCCWQWELWATNLRDVGNNWE